MSIDYKTNREQNPDVVFPSSQPEKPSLGVSFKNLGVYGYRTSSDYHHTVATYVLRVASLFSGRCLYSRSRVDILKGLDGMVRPGEARLVLGRPGSGCSALLKSLAGQFNGVTLSSFSEVNYSGELA
jgi:ABC-type multidrug transport system ATPase subunit